MLLDPASSRRGPAIAGSCSPAPPSTVPLTSPRRWRASPQAPPRQSRCARCAPGTGSPTWRAGVSGLVYWAGCRGAPARSGARGCSTAGRVPAALEGRAGMHAIDAMRSFCVLQIVCEGARNSLPSILRLAHGLPTPHFITCLHSRARRNAPLTQHAHRCHAPASSHRPGLAAWHA